MPPKPKSHNLTKPQGGAKKTPQPRKSNSSRSRKTTKPVPREASPSYLEKLPAEVVCRIGGKLQRRDLKSLTSQSTTIEGPLTWKQARLLVNLSKTRFAKSVEYLHFTKFPANSWQRDLKRHRKYVEKTFPDPALKKLPGEEDDCLVLGLMLAQALKRFENLERISLDFGGAKRTAKDGLTPDPCHFTMRWKESKAPLNSESSMTGGNCRPENVPFWIDGYHLTGRDPKFLSVSDVVLCQPPEYFNACLEELELLNISEMESAGAGFLHCFHHVVVQGENLQSLRKLSIFGCSTDEQGATWIPMLKRLLEESQLEHLGFERNGGVRFDWDGDGKLDRGSRIPQMVEEFGMKPTLEKMISAYCNIYA
ncbi:uncharacterized protein J3D65DRAFT_605842 [Phyllosticta citribraziliensis]|uniref:F-box domain-containing protein n=1 Tax=Phyllosticta citribraziliensis TaxID=989973 RepID=A0ABR1LDL6_9PEZI